MMLLDAIATGDSDAERTRAASPCPARIVTRLKLEQDLLSRARVPRSRTALIGTEREVCIGTKFQYITQANLGRWRRAFVPRFPR